MGECGYMSTRKVDGLLVLFAGDIVPSGRGNPRHKYKNIPCDCDDDPNCDACEGCGSVWVYNKRRAS
jgi:hypothetical protein